MVGGQHSPRKAPISSGAPQGLTARCPCCPPKSGVFSPSRAGSYWEAPGHRDKSRRHPQRAPVQSVAGCGAAAGPGVPPGQQDSPSPAATAVPPPGTPSLRCPLYAAQGGSEVAKPSPSMKGKWQPEGTLPQPPQDAFPGALGSPQPPPRHPLAPGCPRPLDIPGVHRPPCSDAPRGSPARGPHFIPWPPVDAGLLFEAPPGAAAPLPRDGGGPPSPWGVWWAGQWAEAWQGSVPQFPH